MELTTEERSYLAKQLLINVSWIKDEEKVVLPDAALTTIIAIFDEYLQNRNTITQSLEKEKVRKEISEAYDEAFNAGYVAGAREVEAKIKQSQERKGK